MKMPSEFKMMKERFRDKVKLKRRKEFLSELNYMETLSTGIVDKMFFNGFVQEAVQLLINAIFLMEEGYYDCAFYSARQSQEVLNSMLYLSTDNSLLEKWKNKEKFPPNNQILKDLKKVNENYDEFKSVFKDFFDEFEQLITQSNKTIHKQGIDTFYEVRVRYSDDISFNKNDELELFSKIISFSICHLYLIYILLDPLGLILADDYLDRKLNFAPITEPISINYLNAHFPMDFMTLIRTTEFYKSLKITFGHNEDMNDAVYSVIRESFFDLNNLDKIESQIGLLNNDRRCIFVLRILQTGLKVSNFFFDKIWVMPDYWTSIPSNYKRMKWSLEESDELFFNNEKYNVPYHNVYLSAVPMFDDGTLIMEHNEKFSEYEIENLEKVVLAENESHRKMVDELLINLEEYLIKIKDKS